MIAFVLPERLEDPLLSPVTLAAQLSFPED
jgi:hypothetical protein